MTTPVNHLENVVWIRDCDVTWGSMSILAPRPHQEDITAINDFVWRLYVSYRALNAVTETFGFVTKRMLKNLAIQTVLCSTLSWTMGKGIIRLLFERRISVSWLSLHQLVVRKKFKSYLLVLKIHHRFIRL